MSLLLLIVKEKPLEFIHKENYCINLPRDQTIVFTRSDFGYLCILCVMLSGSRSGGSKNAESTGNVLNRLVFLFNNSRNREFKRCEGTEKDKANLGIETRNTKQTQRGS